MTFSELKRWLKEQGCIFQDGTKHTVVMRGKLRTTMARHPTAEVKTGTLKGILKDLDLKKK